MSLALGSPYTFTAPPVSTGNFQVPPVTNNAGGNFPEVQTAFVQQGSLPAGSGQIEYLLRDGSEQNILYAVADGGYYKSWDNGLTWHAERLYPNPQQGFKVGYAPTLGPLTVPWSQAPYEASSEVNFVRSGYAVSLGSGTSAYIMSPRPRSLYVASGGSLPASWQSFSFSDSSWGFVGGGTPIVPNALLAGNSFADSSVSIRFAQLCISSAQHTMNNGDSFLIRQKFTTAPLSSSNFNFTPAAASITANSSGGTIPAGSYFATFTYLTGGHFEDLALINPTHESTPLVNGMALTLTSAGNFILNVGSATPNVMGVNVYLSQAGASGSPYTGPYWLCPGSPFNLWDGSATDLFITTPPNYSTAPQPPAVDGSAITAISNALMRYEVLGASNGNQTPTVQLIGIWLNGTLVGSLPTATVDSATAKGPVGVADVTSLIVPNGDNIVAAQVTARATLPNNGFSFYGAGVSWRIDLAD